MKVTTKGQVTVPARIRDYLGIAPHSDVDFRITDGAVVLIKHEVEGENRDRFSALRGVLKGMRTNAAMDAGDQGRLSLPVLVDTNVLVDVLTDDPQ